MAQSINLSVPQIILYLRDIEAKLYKLPHREYQLPHYMGGEIPLLALNSEAKRIMDHVGLTMFNPNCVWANLPNNTAGDIQLNGSRFGDINIRISEKYRYNGKATVAILAHEVCHKLLEYHGLYFSMMTDINETYTDLCTIYVGFSQLILNGYKTTEGDISLLLGYLNFKNYEQAERITRIIFGSLRSDAILNEPFHTDYEVELAEWVALNNKREEHLRAFANVSRLYSEISRDITILQEILKKIPLEYKEHLDKLDELYFGDDVFNGEVIERPIQAYTLSDPYTYGSDNEQMNEDKATRIKSVLEKMIKAIAPAITNGNCSTISAQRFYCPFCGRESEYKDRNEAKVLKCLSCKKVFYLKEPTIEMSQSNASEPTETIKYVNFWSRLFGKR